LGIALLPDFLITDHIEQGRMEVVMRDYPMPEAGVYVVRPPGGSASSKVRALIDVMVEIVAGRVCREPRTPAS
jgi:DNA-binding transcriptional LysR family regulator